MGYIAMNRFKIAEGREADFEEVWKARESRLKELKGFREFRLLKGPKGDGFTLYSSHVLWDQQADFQAWTKSEQFRDAHRNSGNSKTEGVIIGRPEFEGFETVLHEA
ncbi:antibiotic biosynthesis monooxygenase [Shimia sp. R9_1]|uniref:antibiotic biosynthesis monooxygenase family protein n=1 Tax=Shimia sp. R9_1 TaxID=2821111 RepID=UPI001ADCF9DF|nr:antibiotic biosynthesis monooxygenase [Shimia sp. R9_1]MBO9408576.1 antibiotic biosynthesis monooxygenase [Shimia sp. R9_1]